MFKWDWELSREYEEEHPVAAGNFLKLPWNNWLMLWVGGGDVTWAGAPKCSTLGWSDPAHADGYLLFFPYMIILELKLVLKTC